MSVLEEIRVKAKALHRTIILPEGNEDRTLKAAQMLVGGRLADVILVEDETSIRANATRLGVDLTGVQIVDPKTSPKAAEFAILIYEKRKAKGMTPEKATELSVDPIYFATCMLETGTSGSRSLSDIFIAAHNDPTNSAQEFGHQGDMPVQ